MATQRIMATGLATFLPAMLRRCQHASGEFENEVAGRVDVLPRGRPVRRLVQPAWPRLQRRVAREAVETRAGQDAQAAHDRARLVGDHVAKGVVGEDHAVERARVGRQEQRRRVRQLVRELHLGELSPQRLLDDLPPETRRGQHVGLVEGDDGPGGVVAEGELGSAMRVMRWISASE